MMLTFTNHLPFIQYSKLDYFEMFFECLTLLLLLSIPMWHVIVSVKMHYRNKIDEAT